MDANIRQSLRYSLIDGIFASIMVGMSETFLAPYALAMGASASLIGILISMPALIGSLVQAKSASATEALGSRKALINSAVLVHALLWVPMILLPYIVPDNQAVYLVILYTLFIAANAVAGPAWSSLMADHVPETERGKVFGWRSRVFGIVNVSGMFSAGFILYLFKEFFTGTSQNAMRPYFKFLGFTLIFTIAFFSRLISWSFLTKMHEPPLVIKSEHRFTFFDFLKKIRVTNFGRFVIFVAAMTFSTYIAAPFFAVYMLNDLRFSYLIYTTINMAATLTSLYMVNVWGHYADRVGNLRILKLSSIFIPFIPLLWLVSHNIFYLIMVQIFAGFSWAGFNLSAVNFIYDAVTPEKRTRCIGYFNVINGVAIFSGAALGSLLLNIVPSLFGYKILTVVSISGILRFSGPLLSSSVREVRKVKEVSNLELFYSIIGLRAWLRSSASMSSGKE